MCLSQDIQYISLCYTVDYPFYIQAVASYIQTPNPSSLTPMATTGLLSMKSISVYIDKVHLCSISEFTYK